MRLNHGMIRSSEISTKCLEYICKETGGGAFVLYHHPCQWSHFAAKCHTPTILKTMFYSANLTSSDVKDTYFTVL